GGVGVSRTGDLFIADPACACIRKVDRRTGVLSIVAGGPSDGPRPLGDGGPAIAASLGDPAGVTIDAAGNHFIAGRVQKRIRLVGGATSVITTVAGTGDLGPGGDGGPATAATLDSPEGIAVDGAGNLFIAESARIRRVDGRTGVITTVVGDSARFGIGFAGDGG